MKSVPSNRVDEEMARLADGDESAFERLFPLLWPAMLRFSHHLLTASPAAEDVAQRALIRLFEEAPGYKPGRPVLPWALSLVYWECRSERKRSARANARRGGAIDDAVAGGPSPLDSLLDAEAQHRLSELVSELTEEEAAVLGLADPALIGHLSPSAVRKRRQRLVDRLRGALADLIHGGGE